MKLDSGFHSVACESGWNTTDSSFLRNVDSFCAKQSVSSMEEIFEEFESTSSSFSVQ